MINIQDVLRAGYVKRWNIVNTTRQQTLAEHLFNVAAISEHLLTELDLFDMRDIILSWALVHDVPEVVCGDTPTPTKLRMIENGFDMEAIYNKIDPNYKVTRLMAIERKIPYDLVKLADLMEGIHFLTENGIGTNAKNIARRMDERLNYMIDDFVENHELKLPMCATRAYDKIRATYEAIMFGKIYE